MNIYAPIILCFIPFITSFILFLILIEGTSPIKQLSASLTGLLALIPIVILQMLIPAFRLFDQIRISSILLYGILFCGLIEEGTKAAALFIIPAKKEKISVFFAYSVLAGMILGSFESVIYLVRGLQSAKSGMPGASLNLIYMRTFTTLIVHTLCAGLSGIGVYYKKQIRLSIRPFITAILVHGLYNFFASFTSSAKYFSIAVILFLIQETRILYLKAKSEYEEKNSEPGIKVDPDKTYAIPDSPAIVIPVKSTIPEKEEVQEIAETSVPDGNVENYDSVEQEASAELEKEKVKKPAVRKTATVKKTTAGTKSAPAEKKPVAKKTATSSKSAEPKAETKVKKDPAAKSTTTGKKASAEKKTATEKKTAGTTAKKTTARKTAAKTSETAAKNRAPAKRKGEK